MSEAVYVYAIGRNLDPALLEATEGVGGRQEFHAAASGDLNAVYSLVDRAAFSQEEIDRRGADLQWLGDIGYRHQEVVSRLAEEATIIPLRAFTMFASPDSLITYLDQHRSELEAILDRLEGREEWTVRIEFDPEPWQKAIVSRVPSLAAIEAEMAQAGGGKAYLLKKKLEDERTRAARQAEEDVVGEIESRLRESVGSPMVTESRQRRGGSFPQVDLLVERGRREELASIHRDLSERYRGEGISLALTGPWPPYTFATGDSGE